MRDVKLIDEDIKVEFAILQMDVRGGDNCTDAQATRVRLDKLLDERLDTAVALQAVDGIDLTRG